MCWVAKWSPKCGAAIQFSSMCPEWFENNQTCPKHKNNIYSLGIWVKTDIESGLLNMIDSLSRVTTSCFLLHLCFQLSKCFWYCFADCHRKLSRKQRMCVHCFTNQFSLQIFPSFVLLRLWHMNDGCLSGCAWPAWSRVNSKWWIPTRHSII